MTIWQRQFNGLDTLRRLVQFHSQQLLNSVLYNLHGNVTEVLKLVDSLRSNVAKNALITLNEMSQVLRRQLDSESEPIILRLIKRGNDANTFISEEVKKTLISVAQNCSDAKIIPYLATLNNQRTIPAKINICLCLEAVIQRNDSKSNQLRDFDKLVVMLGNYLLDGAVEVRNIAKRATSQLGKAVFSRSELEKIFQRSFNEINYGKILSILDKELGQGTTSPLMITNSQIKNRSNSKVKSTKSNIEEEKLEIDTDAQPTREAPLTSPMKGKKFTYTREPADFDNLPNLFMLAENNEWKTRHEAVQSLTEFGKKNCDALIKSKQQLKYFDCFMKLLLDSNIKVSSLAINCFTELIPVLKVCIENNIINITNAVFNIMGSVNSTIKLAADALFQTLVKKIDSSCLVPAWTNALPFTNPKAKCVVIAKLNDMVGELYEKKPLLVTKNIIPAAAKCVEETKADIKMVTNKLFQSLYNIMGKSLMDYVPGNKAQIILDIVS